jgi:hypothetical protein
LEMTAFHGSMPRGAVSGWVVVTCLLVGVAPVRAQVVPPFAQLSRQTADAPRQVDLAARAEGQARQAHAQPYPNVSLMTENIARQRPYDGFGRLENRVPFNQQIELGGKRAARVAGDRHGRRGSAAACNGRDRRPHHLHCAGVAGASGEHLLGFEGGESGRSPTVRPVAEV